jgi:hypothetical protein
MTGRTTHRLPNSYQKSHSPTQRSYVTCQSSPHNKTAIWQLERYGEVIVDDSASISALDLFRKSRINRISLENGAHRDKMKVSHSMTDHKDIEAAKKPEIGSHQRWRGSRMKTHSFSVEASRAHAPRMLPQTKHLVSLLHPETMQSNTDHFRHVDTL